MQSLVAGGSEITLVEPRRKSLEDFFLETIRAKSA